ncbi:SDR family NAD(P)-dependent oxidoreductase [Niallia circulans]|uniref:SDR family NAD(P)-dependent oxidoreductase n=1 Tax=Niallia circulans TaxID=1397 RepID=UPI0014903EAD|nr:SDR family NAD(P)-dependent oxidoreductase [Niallia circulans]
MNNILITGGAGFIGSHLSLKLVDKGYKVRVLDNLSEQIHGTNKNIPVALQGKVDFILGDVRNKEDIRRAMKNQDAIIHLAAETGTGQSMYEITKYTDVNVNGTANILEILTNEDHSIQKIVVASSRAIYGEGKYECETHGVVYPSERNDSDMEKGEYEPKCTICGSVLSLLSTDEDSKIHPSSIYGITKQNQEQMVLNIGKAIGVPAVAFRYQNVYGPGQSLSNPYTGILSIFSTRIKNGNDLNIFEDGKESRDFVFIDDIVDATILGLESSTANYNIYNVGSGKPTTVLEVANTLINAYNSNSKITVSGNYRIGDIRHNYADLSKIKKDLSFHPKYSFEDGIKLFVSWVNSQEIKEDLYEKSINEMKEKSLYK